MKTIMSSLGALFHHLHRRKTRRRRRHGGYRIGLRRQRRRTDNLEPLTGPNMVCEMKALDGSMLPTNPKLALDTYLHNLERACAMAKGTAVDLLIEPINKYDRPGYFLSRSDEAADIIADLRCPNLKMMFERALLP